MEKNNHNNRRYETTVFFSRRLQTFTILQMALLAPAISLVLNKPKTHLLIRTRNYCYPTINTSRQTSAEGEFAVVGFPSYLQRLRG